MHNLTQEAVASELAISQNTYSRIERGEITLTEDRKVKILKLLGVSVDDYNALYIRNQKYNLENNTSNDGYSFFVANNKRPYLLPDALKEQYDARIQNLMNENIYLKEQNTQLLSMLKAAQK